MLNFRFLLPAAALALASFAAQAHSFKLGPIDIGHPYARATGIGQANGGAYLMLENHGPADRLLSASTPVAEAAQLHSMSMQGDVMKMRQVDSIDLPTGKSVELKPGAYHVMLVGLKAPLKAGDKFPMKLKFEKAGEIEVTVNIEAPGGAGGTMPMAHDH